MTNFNLIIYMFLKSREFELIIQHRYFCKQLKSIKAVSTKQ